MTYWKRPGSVKDANITGAPFIPLDKLAGSCSAGPNAKDVIPVMGPSKLLGKTPSVNNEATIDTSKDVFGLDPVLLCADINSPFYGIWGLNATGDTEIKNWEEHPELGAAPWGYYIHIFADVPNAQQYYLLRGKGGGWSAGADQQMQDYQPKIWADVRRLMGFPDSNVPAANLPPGPEGFTAGTEAPEEAVEFSVTEDNNFWVAKTPGASAAKKTGNPHPGISIINPGAWDRVSNGQTPSDALDLTEYREMGWTGLDRKILAWQGGGSVAPAQEELGTAMTAAMKGDTGALRALKAVGVSNPKTGEGGGHGEVRFGNLDLRF